MHVFEIAQDLKTSPKDVIKFLCGIGYVVKRDMDAVPPTAEQRVYKELRPVLERQNAERVKKDVEKQKALAVKREADRKRREVEKKKQDVLDKARKREDEKRAQQENDAKELAKRNKAEEKRVEEEAKIAAESEAKAAKTKKEAAKKAEVIKPTAAPTPPAAPVAVEPPAAVKPTPADPHVKHTPVAKTGEAKPTPVARTGEARMTPVAKTGEAKPTPVAKAGEAKMTLPAKPAEAKVHPTVAKHEPQPTAAGTNSGEAKPTPLMLKAGETKQPPLVSRHGETKHQPTPLVLRPGETRQPPLASRHGEARHVPLAMKPGETRQPPLPPRAINPKHMLLTKPVHGAKHPPAKPPAPASGGGKGGAHGKPLEMVPLDRIKKASLTRAEEIKMSLEQAQAQTLTKRSPREEQESEESKAAKKKDKVHFEGVENRDALINRPRLSASAELRQQIAERAVKQRPHGSRMFRKRKHGQHVAAKSAQPTREVVIEPPLTVREFSQATGVKLGDIMRKLMDKGTMATINQHLDEAMVKTLAEELKLEITIKEPGMNLAQYAFAEDEEDEEVAADKARRAPVVTFMGHVDHGKTSLLDAIRQTNVAGGESGGITQHIGAYEVACPSGTITFIDTPGHEAFTAMRARGAHVTDIAVLVVAADDGLMPQSIEAISHARAANVPILVAINKCDLPGANPDRVLKQLADHNLNPEDWGGETICCRVSAITKEGIPHLLEMIALQAEVLTDENGEPKLIVRSTGSARGVVLEAVLDPNQGPTVTLLVQEGLLQRGDPLVCDTCFGRARALLNHIGKQIEQAGPGQPVRVLGFSEVPVPGTPFRVATSEKHARELVDTRRTEEQLRRHAHTQKITLENFFKSMASEAVKVLPLIIKGDTQGTTEALRTSLERLTAGNAKVQVLHCGVGDVTENDIMLASASNAVVLGFRVNLTESARPLAKSEGVDITMYDVIYHATEAVQAALAGLLDPVFNEVETGVAQVRAVFDLSSGKIAGCYIQSGTITRNNKARVVRDGETVYEGDIQSLRRVKDEVREVREGFECGILLRDWKDAKEGDLIRAYKLERESPLAAG